MSYSLKLDNVFKQIDYIKKIKSHQRTCSGFSKVIGVKTKEETGYFELTKNWHTLFD